jgi:hypothetical protein
VDRAAQSPAVSAENRRRSKNRRAATRRFSTGKGNGASSPRNVHRTRKRERWSVVISFLSVIVAAGAVAMSWRSAEASDKSAQASQEQVEIAKRGKSN